MKYLLQYGNKKALIIDIQVASPLLFSSVGYLEYYHFRCAFYETAESNMFTMMLEGCGRYL